MSNLSSFFLFPKKNLIFIFYRVKKTRFDLRKHTPETTVLYPGILFSIGRNVGRCRVDVQMARLAREGV